MNKANPSLEIYPHKEMIIWEKFISPILTAVSSFVNDIHE
jgi:hypothetical protein